NSLKVRNLSDPISAPHRARAEWHARCLITYHSSDATISGVRPVDRPGAGGWITSTNHEQASFSLAVPGPLVGGRAFSLSTPKWPARPAPNLGRAPRATR